MSLQLVTGYTFASGEQNVTHTKLNNQVNAATAVAGSIASADIAADAITADLINSNVAGSGLAQDVDGSLKVVGYGVSDTALTNANQTLTRGTSKRTQRFSGALTGAVVINLSRTNAVNGDKFRIVLNNTVDATKTLTIQENGSGSLIVFNDASFPVVKGTLEAEYDGSSWALTLIATNESAT